MGLISVKSIPPRTRGASGITISKYEAEFGAVASTPVGTIFCLENLVATKSGATVPKLYTGVVKSYTRVTGPKGERAPKGMRYVYLERVADA